MNQDRTKRKLTTILSADVVGYSRLMEADEAWTIRNLDENKRLISELIEEYGGGVIDAIGDNLLAEFSSVINSVECAVRIQQELKRINAILVENRRMEFRIGINLGDVVVEDDRVYGNGVNIAARLEGLAKPGGICISGSTYEHVKTNLDIGYEYLGEHHAKNISEPIQVYQVVMGMESSGKAIGESAPVIRDVGKAPKTIAVLPFIDLSPEKDQGYFVDGLSEEILNSLCQIPDLGVAGRTSSFSFKGSNKTIQEIAIILKVGNILEGSVRKAGGSLRITAQLLRGADGFLLWSKTYNRELKDIFEIQEDIATRVADELKVTLGIGKSLKQLGGTNNVEAYELYLVAKGQFYDEELGRAIESIDAAIALEPDFALAWALKVSIHSLIAARSPTDCVAPELDSAMQAAERAIDLEPSLGKAYLSLGIVHMNRGEFIEAELAYRKGMEQTTESIDYFEYGLSWHYAVVGYLRKCHELLEEMRRNDPLKPLLRAHYILSLSLLGDIKGAEEEYERGKAIFGDQWVYGDLYITTARLGAKDIKSYNKIKELPAWSPVFIIGKEKIETREEGLLELRKLYADYENLTSINMCVISLWAAYFGDTEFALNTVERSVSLYGGGVFIFYWAPVFREVRQLPRFKEIVRKIGLVDYWKEFGWPDLCHPVGDDDFVCE